MDSKACRIVPVARPDLLQKVGIFLASKTLRKNACEGKNPSLFLKIGGRLFIDLDEWDKLVSRAREKTSERVNSLRARGLIPNED